MKLIDFRAGGGKGVIAAPEYDISHPGIRKQMFMDYGDFLSSLNGCYGKAEQTMLFVTALVLFVIFTIMAL